MRKLLVLTLLGGVGAGAFFAFRWFRGDTAYEEAVRALDEEPMAPTAHTDEDASAPA